MATLLLVLIYTAFISLGLPDALLGAAWPVMQPEFGVPYGFAGLLSMSITGGTILSAIFATRVLKKFGTGKVTAFSVGLTAIALLGFSFTPSYWWLFLAAIPLGLGAGAVDAGLNAFVAEHYESRHMSWLHSFWGVGALSGPLVISGLLERGATWRNAYLAIGLFQVVLVLLLIAAVPLWGKVKTRVHGEDAPEEHPHLPLFFPLKVQGVKQALVTMFCYCAIESTMGLWGGSFLFKTKAMDAAAAATWVSLFFAAITAGRFLTGFATSRVSNKDLIRWGGGLILAGVALMLVPLPLPFTLAGFLLVGFGCAPVFPCMIHETPVRFGKKQAQAIIGFQMAAAYIGATFMPPLFGFIGQSTTLALLPVFLVGYSVVLLLCTEGLRRKSAAA